MKEDFIESSNYSLTENEEISHIADINCSLENFEKVLKDDSDDMNDIKILEASKISESMLQLFLKNEGYLFKNNTPFSYMIEISTNKELIPQECTTFLQIIKE